MNTDVQTMQEKLEGALDKEVTGTTLVNTDIGGIHFQNMGEVMEFSKLMALGAAAIPPHLRGNPGACLGVCVQALGWRMDPFAVANKSYFVNDRLSYEAQLVQAVIDQRAPIKGRIKGEYTGEGPTRQLTVWAILEEDGERVDYTSPLKKDIGVQNSPLWKSDPDQQLWYYSTRAMCRRHFPDVILGVYAKDELGERMKDVTPRKSFTQKLAAQNAPDGDQPPATDDQPEKGLDEAGGSPVEDAEEVQTETQGGIEPEIGSEEFLAGANCNRDGIPLADCPHELGTQEAADWMEGWKGMDKAGEVGDE